MDIGNELVAVDQAKVFAQRWLDAHLPGAIAEDMHSFYGYYTVHVTTDGRIHVMLSVNAHTSQIWHHNWHGAYIQTKELSEH